MIVMKDEFWIFFALGFLIAVGLVKASCVNPYDYMVITNDTILCRGTYNMNTSIRIENGTLYCNETVLIGNGTFDGMHFSSNAHGASIKKTSDANFGCKLVNFSMGISVPQNLRNIAIEDVIFEGLTAGGTQLENTTFTIKNLKAYNFEGKAVLLKNSTGYIENIYGENLAPESVLGIWNSVDTYIRINNLTAVNSSTVFGMYNTNVTVDFMDSYLKCINSKNGFTLSRVEDITLENINVENCGWSISFDHASQINVKNATVLNSSERGITLDHVDGVTIENVYIDNYNNGYHGVGVYSCSGITIKDSVFKNATICGIYFEDTNNSVVSGCDIIGGAIPFYGISSNLLDIHGNKLSGGFVGLDIFGSDIQIHDNEIYGSSYSGIFVASNNTYIYNNTIRDLKYGIEFLACYIPPCEYVIENVTIMNNNITNCNYAGRYAFGQGATFRNIVACDNKISNIINATTYALYVGDGTPATMENVMRIDSDSCTPYMDISLSKNQIDFGVVKPNMVLNETITLYVNTNLLDDTFEITGTDIGSVPLSSLNISFVKVNYPNGIYVECRNSTGSIVDCSELNFRTGMAEYSVTPPATYLDALPSLDNTINLRFCLQVPPDVKGTNTGTVTFKVSGDVSDEETLTITFTVSKEVTFMSVFPLGALLFGILVPLVFGMCVYKLLFIEKYELTFSGVLSYIMAGVAITLLAIFFYYIVYFITQPA